MSNKVMVLSVDGGEVESFLGVFRNRDKLMQTLAEERDGGNFTVEEGYVTADPEIDEEGNECIYVHREGTEPFDYSLCFIIRYVDIIE